MTTTCDYCHVVLGDESSPECPAQLGESPTGPWWHDWTEDGLDPDGDKG